MKVGLMVGVGVALIAGLSMAYAAHKNRKGEPVTAGQRIRVIYGTSNLSENQTLALLSFVAAWGSVVEGPEFLPNSEVMIVADVEVDQPNGIPDIPGTTETGDLFVSLVEFL